jgi:hypothetical protein
MKQLFFVALLRASRSGWSAIGSRRDVTVQRQGGSLSLYINCRLTEILHAADITEIWDSTGSFRRTEIWVGFGFQKKKIKSNHP